MNQRPRPRAGLYDDLYWSFAAQGELRLQECDSCGAYRYPPGPACPDCGSEDATWSILSGRGRLLSWTTFHRQYFATIPPPYVVAAIRTVEGPIVIGNAVEVEPSRLVLDMDMTAVFEDVEEPTGAWRICQWRPTSYSQGARKSHDHNH